MFDDDTIETGILESADGQGACSGSNVTVTVTEFMSAVVPWPTDGFGHVNLHYSMINPRAGEADQEPVLKGMGWPFKDIGTFIQRAFWISTIANFRDVWFCTSRQRDAALNTKGKPKALRRHANAMDLKAIWIDVDVKPNDTTGKHYTTMKEAWDAICAFRVKVGLPQFSAVVNSGGGLHLYWVSDRPLEPAQWLPYAAGLKALLLKEGVRCDAGLTTDDVRLLRVPGTFNHKYDPPREVQLMPLPLAIYDFAATMSFLATVAPAPSAPAGANQLLFDPLAFTGVTPILAASATDTLGAGIEKRVARPLDPGPVFAQCPFMEGALAKGGADLDQPLWNISVLATTFMENGDVHAHAISKDHAAYSASETQALYDRKMAERTDRGIGYPSCKTIAGLGCKACTSCSHYSKKKSPLNLTAPVVTAAVNLGPGIHAAGQERVEPEWPDGCNKFGTPVKGYANTLAAFRRLNIKCIYDMFRQKEYSEGHQIAMLNGELSDRTVTMLRDQIRRECGFYPDKETVREAITAECLRNRVNPVVNYFKSLKWDGVERLSKLLHRYLGADDTPLNEAISVKFMCAVVRRSKQPGCKYDHEVVIQGGQGVRKSMFCEDLAVFPDLFTDAGDLSGSIKEQMEIAQGKQIIEFPELAGFNQNSRERNKGYLSRRVDRARLAYAHYARDEPRSSVPIGTTNPGGYLNDPTGERRYWHAAVKKYDREAFLSDKNQLYAEAVVREPKENLWLDTPELVAAHDAIVVTAKEPNALVDDLADLTGDIWETSRDKIDGGWVIHREERISNRDVRGKLGIYGADVLRLKDLGRRIGDAMMAQGWSKADGTLVCKHGSAAEGGYRRPLPDHDEMDEVPVAIAEVMPMIPIDEKSEA
jgi:hypothetical protein